MKEFEVILFTGQSPSNLFFCRYAGPHRLATELRKNNIPTKVINGLGQYLFEELVEICDRFITKKTLVLGFSTTFLVEFAARFDNKKEFSHPTRAIENINKIISYYKKKFPQIKVVLGGPSSRSKNIDPSNVDLYVEGYADTILVDYVMNVKTNSPKFFSSYANGVPFVTNPLDNQGFKFKESIILYENEDAIFQGDTLPLEISRGCIFNCKFCSYPLKGRSPKDNSFIKSLENLETELLQNYDKFGVTKYIFVDDTYNDSVPKLESLYKLFSRMPFRMEFATYLRIDLLYANPDTIDLLLKSGLRGAFFGIETLNEKSKKIIGKGLSVEKTLKTLDRVNKEWGDEVVTTSSFIYGLPTESVESMNKWTDEYVFNSGIFDKQDLVFQPLFLANKVSTYNNTDLNSGIDLEKYNYKRPEDPSKQKFWTNNYTSFSEVLQMAKDANNRVAETARPIGNFYLLALMGCGLSFEEASKLDINNERDLKKITEITRKRYIDYKKKIND